MSRNSATTAVSNNNGRPGNGAVHELACQWRRESGPLGRRNGVPPPRGKGGLPGDGQAQALTESISLAEEGAVHSVTAPMCSEKDPLNRHHRHHRVHDVRHILADQADADQADAEPHTELLERLMRRRRTDDSQQAVDFRHHGSPSGCGHESRAGPRHAPAGHGDAGHADDPGNQSARALLRPRNDPGTSPRPQLDNPVLALSPRGSS